MNQRRFRRKSGRLASVRLLTYGRLLGLQADADALTLPLETAAEASGISAATATAAGTSTG